MKKLLVLTAIVALIGCRRQEAKHTEPHPYATRTTTTTSSTQPTEPVTPATSVGTAIGAQMPPYSAPMLDGKTFDPASEKGNVLLLNIWATWCEPCRSELPQLQALHAKHAREGFKVIGVSVDETGIDGVREFVQKEKISFPIAVDADGKLAQLFHTPVIPTSVLLDRRGRIVWKKFSMLEEHDRSLEEALTKALSEPRS